MICNQHRRGAAMAALSAIVFSLAGHSVRADLTFDAAITAPVGIEPDGAIVDDFDGDGMLDLAVSFGNPDRIELFRHEGVGVFTPAGTVLLPNSSSPDQLIAGDFAGDGTIDLAVSLKDSAAVAVLLNDGAMNFTHTATIPTADEPRGLAAGDLDGDGDLDLVVANAEGNSISIVLNEGGTFTAVTLPAGADPREVALADFDGDDDLDLAVSSHDTREVLIYTNAKGTFTLAQSLSTGAAIRPDGLAVGDFDQNGTIDLAAGTGDPGSASVWLNSGNAVFAARMDYPTNGLGTGTILAADLNCDGFADLITVNADSGTLSLLENLGDGTFAPAVLLVTGVDPQQALGQDVDGDGDLDLLTINQGSGDLSLFINHSCANGSTTIITDASVFFGVHLTGDAASLAVSDDQFLRTRSRFGFTAIEPNLMELRVGFLTDQPSASLLDLAIESRINHPSGTAKLRLRNWMTNSFQPIDEYPVTATEAVHTVPDVPATGLIRADGRIELSVRHIVVAVFTATGFDSFFDHIDAQTH